MPRELFEELMAPLKEEDVSGLERKNGHLVPTKATKATHQFNYLIKRGSVSDRLFRLQDMDPSPASDTTQPKRGALLRHFGVPRVVFRSEHWAFRSAHMGLR